MDVHEALEGAAAAAVDAVDWDAAGRVAAPARASVAASALIEVPGGVVEVHGGPCAARTLFAARLARLLQVQAPACRIVRSGTPERAALQQRVAAILGKAPDWPAADDLVVLPGPAGARALADADLTDNGTLVDIGRALVLALLLHGRAGTAPGTVWAGMLDPGRLLRCATGVRIGSVALDHDEDLDDSLDDSLRELAIAVSSSDALQQALEPLGLPGDAQGALHDGVVAGLGAAMELDRGKLEDLVAQVAAEGHSSAWQREVRRLDVDAMCQVLGVLCDAPLCPVEDAPVALERLEGERALADALKDALGQAEAAGSGGKTAVFLDFDRTLTCGFGSAGEGELRRRVRGGADTVEALRAAQNAGAAVFVVTARRPRVMVLQQLEAQLRGAQRELGEVLLPPEDGPIAGEVLQFLDVPLALAPRARLYATDYEKAAAIAHALCTQLGPTSRVLFVDDVATNAHGVGRGLGRALRRAGRADLAASVRVESFWWDPFAEETCAMPTLTPVGPDSTDFAYHEYLAEQLRAFGIEDAERKRRHAIYLELVPPAKPKEARKPGKLAASSKHAGLAAALFGAGPRPPRPPASN